MVGYDPSSLQKISSAEQAVAGAFSGCVTRCVLQPLDVVKVRFQLQVEPISAGCTQAKYCGVKQAMFRIAQEEGFSALWKGHLPAQLMSFTMGAAQFSSFELIAKKIWEHFPSTRTESRLPMVHFVCGAAAGVVANATSFPFDLIRTRLIAQGEPKTYNSLKDAVVKIYAQDGMRGFYRGLTPTLIQIAPHSGAQFGFYALITATYNRWAHLWGGRAAVGGQSNVVESLICGSLAGICAKTMVYPLDLAKKRMQVQGFSEARKNFGTVFHCKGLIQCLQLTVRNEGMRGMYKGWWPSMVKAATTTALNFTVYEQTCRAIWEFHR